jgi:apolipoprotein D and lipocalin family protein
MYRVIIIILIAFEFISGQENNSDPKTVSYVDLNLYKGLWYEAAKIPNSFQDHCTSNATAYYNIMEDGTIEVINSCREEDGEIDTAKGIAHVVDTLTNSKLEVSFVSIFGIHLFWGDYWILGLGEKYEYAVVGTPSRKYGWILSRSRKMSEDLIEEAYSILEQQGYNRLDFERTIQDE